jgi:hypothetical protein
MLIKKFAVPLNKKVNLLTYICHKYLVNRALSPTRWHYHSQVYVAAFVKNLNYFCKEKKALAFN